MTAIRIRPLPTDLVRALQAGGPDADGRAPERVVSDGSGNPCRHCLRDIPAGAPMLILALRPFPRAQPYAEQGPVFLCGEPCRAFSGPGLPPIMASRERYLIRGYGADDRIVYGTGAAIPTEEIAAHAARLLARPEVAYLHLRSAAYNCYQARVERA